MAGEKLLDHNAMDDAMDAETLPLHTANSTYLYNEQPRRATSNNRLIYGLYAVGFLVCFLTALNVALIRSLWPHSVDDCRIRESIPKQYGSSYQYMSLAAEYDWLWEDFSSPERGLVQINHESKDQEPQYAGIGMFHALHCLAGMRHALQRSQNGENIGVNNFDDPHWPHCMDYLRQAILCAADDTLEVGAIWEVRTETNGTRTAFRTGSIEGNEDVRRCGDSDKLSALRAEYGMKSEVSD